MRNFFLYKLENHKYVVDVRDEFYVKRWKSKIYHRHAKKRIRKKSLSKLDHLGVQRKQSVIRGIYTFRQKSVGDGWFVYASKLIFFCC